MQAVLTEIISLLTGGISQMATAVGSGFSSLMKNIFLTGEGTTADPYALSVAGGVIVVFAGIAFAIGLSRLVANYLFGLGK